MPTIYRFITLHRLGLGTANGVGLITDNVQNGHVEWKRDRFVVSSPISNLNRLEGKSLEELRDKIAARYPKTKVRIDPQME